MGYTAAPRRAPTARRGRPSIPRRCHRPGPKSMPRNATSRNHPLVADLCAIKRCYTRTLFLSPFLPRVISSPSFFRLRVSLSTQQLILSFLFVLFNFSYVHTAWPCSVPVSAEAVRFLYTCILILSRSFLGLLIGQKQQYCVVFFLPTSPAFSSFDLRLLRILILFPRSSRS